MNNSIFDKFPVLKTNQLLLRAMNLEDAQGVFEFNSSIENLKYVPRTPFSKFEESLEKTKSFIDQFDKHEGIWWTITYKNSNELIGYCGLFDIDTECNKAEIGYGLLKNYWGMGLMSKIVDELVNFGFNDMKLHKIYAKIDPENSASIKVIKNNNFIYEGLLKDDAYARNKYFDMAIYSLIEKKSRP